MKRMIAITGIGIRGPLDRWQSGNCTGIKIPGYARAIPWRWSQRPRITRVRFPPDPLEEVLAGWSSGQLARLITWRPIGRVECSRQVSRAVREELERRINNNQQLLCEIDATHRALLQRQGFMGRVR